MADLPFHGQLKLLVQDLVEEVQPDVVVLHGSVAKGTYIPGLSDIDLLIVSGEYKAVDAKDRFVRLLELAQRRGLPVEAFGYTPEEFLNMVENLNFYVLDVLYYGVPLHDRAGFWKKAKKLFQEVERRHCLEKTETGGWKFKD